MSNVKAQKYSMRFHANFVLTSVAGEYYQALFEKGRDEAKLDSPYLLIQRQFEMSDGGKCYVETHNEECTGHFRLRCIDFSQNGISIEIECSSNNSIHVTVSMTNAEFDEAMPILKIISGEMDPYAE